MATRIEHTNSSGAGLILLLFIVVIVALALAVGAVDTLPLTNHAQVSHQDSSINAASLAAMISTGVCWEIEVWECPDSTTIILCKIKNNVVGGLVIGANMDGTQHIITGYAARSSYWGGFDELSGKMWSDGCVEDITGTFALQ